VDYLFASATKGVGGRHLGGNGVPSQVFMQGFNCEL
jgi:hypothetical protein